MACARVVVVVDAAAAGARGGATRGASRVGARRWSAARARRGVGARRVEGSWIGCAIGVDDADADADADDANGDDGRESMAVLTTMKVGELRARLVEVYGYDVGEVKGMKKAALVEALARRGAAGGAAGVSGDASTATVVASKKSSSSYQQTMFNAKLKDAISGGEEIDDERKSNFSGAELTFLGTSSGAPSFTRNVSSLALRLENEIWLFDCGEATQHQLMRSQLKYAKITKIFITHMHGDHIFGLPGLICAISGTRTSHMRAHGGKVEPLHITGPPGIRQYIYSAMTWSRSVLGMPLIVTEMRQTARAGGGVPAPHTSVDPRGKIFMGECWPENAAEPPPHFKDERAWTELGSSGQLPRWTVYRDGNLCVRATPLRHPVPCFGYVIDECDQPGRLDAEKAISLGLAPGREYRLLKEGKEVTAPNGATIRPEDVIGPSRPGRRLVLLGDTCNSSAIASMATGADVLVHESTFNGAKRGEAIFKGHSTATMAGTFAADVKARSLILTHFSNRYAGGFQSDREDINSGDLGATIDEDDCEDMVLPNAEDALSEENVIGERTHVDTLVREAIEAKGDNRVVAASDFFSFNVQRREEFDDYDRAKGNRDALFAGPMITIPETFVVPQDGGDGDHHHNNGSNNAHNGASHHQSRSATHNQHRQGAHNSRQGGGGAGGSGAPRRSTSSRADSRAASSSTTPRRAPSAATDVASAYFPGQSSRRASSSPSRRGGTAH